MSIKTIFDFKFPESAREEGLSLAKSIGGDMPPLDGFLDVEVIQDVTDPGHLLVITRWSSQEQAKSVLSNYNNDPKIARATALIGNPPDGTTGNVIMQA